VPDACVALQDTKTSNNRYSNPRVGSVTVPVPANECCNRNGIPCESAFADTLLGTNTEDASFADVTALSAIFAVSTASSAIWSVSTASSDILALVTVSSLIFAVSTASSAILSDVTASSLIFAVSTASVVSLEVEIA